jgi:hypothetical protein
VIRSDARYLIKERIAPSTDEGTGVMRFFIANVLSFFAG